MKRLVAADLPAFVEFTYGKRVNKAFKGTEKAGDLLRILSGESRLIERAADRLGFVPITQFKSVADLSSETTSAKSNKSPRSPVTLYDY